jgi:low affinity Fe/Cu permease
MVITNQGTADGQPEKSKRITVDRAFQRFTERVARWSGSKWAVILSLASIVLWLAFGPLYEWSTPYQLIANTGTTLVTYALVFIIQNTTNRETKAISVKLDELVRATESARNEVIGLEEKTEVEIAAAADEIRTAIKPKRKKR